jgi:glyoxylase-like metal-dependent hydrolase (beta-lactamase superfamily II)
LFNSETTTWESLAAGVLRTTRLPYAYALVHGDAAVVVGGPAGVGPQSLPPGVAKCDLVLLTHSHRDTTDAAAGFVAAGMDVRSGASSSLLTLESINQFWTTSMPVETPGRFPPLFERLWGVWSYLVVPEGTVGVRTDLADGDTIDWQGWTIEAVTTPGHSRDHLAFLVRPPDSDAVICFCGDAICAPGKVWSPYTMEWHHQQNEGLRLAAESLRKLATHNATMLCPEHGPTITSNVEAALTTTAERLERAAVLKDCYRYAASRAGDPPSYRYLAEEQVESANPSGNPLPWSQLSPHLLLTGNTYALLSQDGPVMLIDPYSQNTAGRVEELKRDFGAGPVEIAVITHAHNDHYTGIFALPDRDHFDIWALDLVADVVGTPHRYRAPYIDARAVHFDRRLSAGETVHWREFQLKIHHLPGQTYFTMGIEILIDGKRCFFTADNFFRAEQASGSGGWSGHNRALPLNYAESARQVLEASPDWILAEHGGPFEFHEEDFRHRHQWALEAAAAADAISPSGNHLLDWDPHRIHIEPIIVPARPADTARCQLVAHNPTDQKQQLEIHFGRPQIASGPEMILNVAPGETSLTEVELEIAPGAPKGRQVVPCTVRCDGDSDPADLFVVIDING